MIPCHVFPRGKASLEHRCTGNWCKLDSRTHGKLKSSFISLNCKAGGREPLGYNIVPVPQKRTWESRVGHKEVPELMGMAYSDSIRKGSACCPQS